MDIKYFPLLQLYKIRKRVIKDFWETNSKDIWYPDFITKEIESFDDFVKNELPHRCNYQWKLALGKEYLKSKKIKQRKEKFKKRIGLF